MDLKRVIASAPKKHDKGEAVALLTPWGELLDSAAVLQEHPHPQFARSSFRLLNGWWECEFVPHADAGGAWRTAMVPEAFSERVLVPFTPGALLSGVDRVLQPGELLWYKRSFEAPVLGAADRCLLHFEALDWSCSCYVNGVRVGEHVGGYLPFAFDVTEALHNGENELAVCVFDPTDAGTQLRGKQQLESGGIWYTAQGGIWQSVWLEVVPAVRIESVSIEAQASGFLAITAHLLGRAEAFEVELRDAQGELVARECVAVGEAIEAEAHFLPTGEGAGATDLRNEQAFAGECSSACEGFGLEANCVLGKSSEPELFRTTRTVAAVVSDARVWSPDDPYLYDITLRYGGDEVHSYCGFRTVSMEEDAAGVKRFCLNGKPLFLKGVLDQGYWSDGLLTAPSDEALAFDVQAMKSLGFNMLRKHIKVECDRWYYHCDKLGMLVWQDAVSGGGSYSAWHTSYKPTLFRSSWHACDDAKPARYANLSAGDAAYRAEWEETCLGMIEHLGNHPSIVTWVLFNEGWGQFDARRMTSVVRSVDASRPVDAVSGWYDQSCGDFHSVHNYFRNLEVWRDHAQPDDVRDCCNASGKRAFVISEFGGLVLHVPDHSVFASSYGYESFESPDAWRAAVRETLAEVEALRDQGLAGYVYTQLSDVEEETNGLLTFDRRVNKLAGE